MIRQKHKQEIFAKTGAVGREQPLTSPPKNTTMHLNGHSLRLATKNGRDSKAPALHLSAPTEGGGEEAGVGQLMPVTVAPSREGGCTQQRDPPLLRSTLPDLERETETLPPRRPLKLAPLEIPKGMGVGPGVMAGVGAQQSPKVKRVLAREEVKGVAAAHKLDLVAGVPGSSRPRKLKSRLKDGVSRSPECPPLGVLSEPAKSPREKQRVLGTVTVLPPSTTRAVHDRTPRHLTENGTSDRPTAPLPPPCLISGHSGRLVPPSPSLRARSAHAVVRENEPSGDPSGGRRRLRLRRQEHCEEDQARSNTVTVGGLPSQGNGLVVASGQGRGLRADRTLREASRVLEKAAALRRSAPGPPQRLGGIVVAGTGIRKQVAVGSLQGTVH